MAESRVSKVFSGILVGVIVAAVSLFLEYKTGLFTRTFSDRPPEISKVPELEPNQQENEPEKPSAPMVATNGSPEAPGQGSPQASVHCPDDLTFQDTHLRVGVGSVKKTGNKVDLTLIYENLTNEPHRIAIYSGGAAGRDTMLMDDQGEKWELLKPYKGGREGPEGKIFVPGARVKVPITFVKQVGTLDLESFSLINYAHILAAAGPTAHAHWTQVTIGDIPVDCGR